MTTPEPIECELMVIGAGMAGMAAAVFAATRGIDTVHVGGTGEIIYASGLLDLLGVYPAADKRRWSDPWAAIQALRKDRSKHPYARLKIQDIKAALNEFMAHLDTAELHYRHYKTRNTEILTPAGTLKLTYGVPTSMWSGAMAWKKKWPCLLVDFKGLKGFSARQICEILKPQWPDVRYDRIEWPEASGELYPERLARQLEQPHHRRQLGQILKKMLAREKAVGVPAILGIEQNPRVVADLEAEIGCSVFEIPTLPPAITGIRLREALIRHLTAQNVRAFYQMKVLRAHHRKPEGFVFDIGRSTVEATVRARATVLASGRFIGQGLAADHTRIRETIFDLPVHQPPARDEWHQLDFLDPRGHAINRAGVEIDNAFRPVGKNGQVIHPNLYAVGSILAHADWIRLKCGSGLAIATAYAAINAYLAHRT